MEAPRDDTNRRQDRRPSSDSRAAMRAYRDRAAGRLRATTVAGRRLQAIALAIFLLTLLGCRNDVLGPEETPSTWLPKTAWPTMLDDLDRPSLTLALQRSMTYLRRLSADRMLPFGDRQVSVATLLQTLEQFEQLLTKATTAEAFNAGLREQFDIVQAVGRDGRGEVLFTGYHEIILEGSLQTTRDFLYPLYTPPPDLLKIDLSLFHPRYDGEYLIARYSDGNILPYFTRREIDTEGKLQGRGLEFAWLRDPVERFFLHIEGSGKIRLPDGQTLQVGYAASNGHPYRSIGRLLIDTGQLTPDAVSLQGLRRYLRAHPQERAQILDANPRYIFFRPVAQGPRGSLDLVLVPGRSIATDARLFPPAGLAFMQTQKPLLNPNGTIVGWQPMSRFVLNHDTGSAITGPGRVDLFWGSDATAEIAAGHMKHPGNLFFLLRRPDTMPKQASYNPKTAAP